MDEEVEPADVDAPPADDERIVDIRSPDAYRRGHIPGSENVPFQRIPDEVASFADADRIVTVCPHGKASVQAARLVASYEGTDATVQSMAGGLEAWDGPLESSDDPASDDQSTTAGASTTDDESTDAPF